MSKPTGPPDAAPATGWRCWWAGVSHALPAVVLLTLLTAIVHAMHWFDRVDGWFLREAVQAYLQRAHDSAPAPPAPAALAERFTVLEFSALARVKELELDAEHVTEADLERVGGVRPIDRAKLAAALGGLAARLGALEAQKPRVIAIDVDIAPLVGTDEGAQQAMAAAIAALRRHAHVVVAALARPDEATRSARDAFMRALACTRATEAAGAGAKVLAFASPRFFHDRDGYPLKFPFEPARDGVPHAFPSLGNLVAQLVGARPQGHQPWPAAVTALCEGAFAGPLLEDCIEAGPRRPAGCHPMGPDDYELRRLNWPLLDQAQIELTRVGSVAALAGAGARPEDALDAVGDHLLASDALFVGIDGGRRHDKFAGATVDGQPIGGAVLHALAAASARPAGQLQERIGVGLLADFGIGTLFAMTWSLVAIGLRRLEMARLAQVARLLRLLLPPLIAAALGWAAMAWLSPWLLGLGHWANPVYVLVGLTAHAYVEAAEAAQAPRAGPCPHALGHAVPDFLYGARSAVAHGTRDAWIGPILAALVVLAGLVSIGRLHWPDGVMAAVVMALAVAWTARFGRHA